MSKKNNFFIVIPDDGGGISFLKEVNNIVQKKQYGYNIEQPKKGMRQDDKGCRNVCRSQIGKSSRLSGRVRRY